MAALPAGAPAAPGDPASRLAPRRSRSVAQRWPRPSSARSAGAGLGAAAGAAGGYIRDSDVKRQTSALKAARLQPENEELRRQLEAQKQQPPPPSWRAPGSIGRAV